MNDINFDDVLTRLAQIVNSSSPKSLAAALEISEQAVYKSIRNKRFPTTWVYRIAKKFRILPDWLLFGRGPMWLNEGKPPEHSSGGIQKPMDQQEKIEALKTANAVLEAANAELQKEIRMLEKHLLTSQRDALTAYKMLVQKIHTAANPFFPQRGEADELPPGFNG